MGRDRTNTFVAPSFRRDAPLRGPRAWYLVLPIFVLLFSPSPATPQEGAASGPTSGQTQADTHFTGEELSSYEGQNVTAAEIAGRPNIIPAEFASSFAQQPDQPFSEEKVKQTATALKEATKCQAVRILVEPEATGVRVSFVLEPAVYFGIFQFPGAEEFPYSRLIQVANYPVQTPYSANEVEQDRQALLKFFRQQGYFQSEVSPETKVDDKHGIANIVFQVSLRHRARFGALDITDGSPEQDAAFAHSLQTLFARARGSAIRPGRPYNFSTLTRATQYLQSALEKKGLLSGKVSLSGADYHADTNRANIHFSVNSGSKTAVKIEGARIWSWTRKSLLPVYQGVGVDDESVEEGRQALISYFQDKGFFDVKVDAQMQTSKSNNSIVYQIAKESKHKVKDVTVSGNAQLPSSDLTPHLVVKKAHIFSPGDFSDKLVRSSVNNLIAVYQAEGFSSVKVIPNVVNHGGDIQVSFRVIEGPRDIVTSIKVDGATTVSMSEFAPKGLKLAVGQPYSQRRVQEDRAEIISHYLQSGYLTASFREAATQASKQDPHSLVVVYHIHEGPKVTAGDVLTLGRARTKQRLIDEDTAGIKTGEVLTESKLLIAGSQLYDQPGVFDWAEVDPKREITTQTTEDVLVKVHEAKKNELTYGFGFELINRGGSIPSGTVALPNLPPIGLPSNYTTSQTTFYGPRGTIQYTRNDVRGKGDSISFTGFAGRLDQRVAAYYIDPQFRWSKWRATTSISTERNEENPIFSAQQELASTQFQRSLDAAKKDSLFLRYSFTQTDLTRIEIPMLVLAADQHVRLSTLAANVTRDTRDNAMDEHKGVLQSVELDFNTTKLGSSVDFAKLNTQAAFYKQSRHNIVWANSIRVGLAQPFAGSRVPVSEAFFTGGGNSLRGYPLDGAGPQRAVDITGGGCNPKCTIQVPSGGNELLLLNSEARIPIPFKAGLSLVPFYDGGNVFPNVGFHDFTSLYSNNIGIGLRYATPVGPIRFDLGHNLNPIAGITSTNYFISIGQAF
jgi:outer membrane protein insertion porin family